MNIKKCLLQSNWEFQNNITDIKNGKMEGNSKNEVY